MKGGARSPARHRAPARVPESGAGLPRRLGAMVYDAMLVLALWLVTLFPMVALANDAVSGAAVQTLVFLELYAFFVFFWLYRGQTLGMLAWKLEIHTEDGAPLTLARATLRFFAAVLPLIFAAFTYRLFGAPAALLCIGLGAFGYLWILVDPARRSWTDLISGTRILPRRAAPPTDV